jgi:hypothetical protein
MRSRFAGVSATQARSSSKESDISASGATSAKAVTAGAVGTMGSARSGWLSRGVLMLTFIGMAGSVVAMAISYIRG